MRRTWLLCIASIVAVGLLSRLVRTGFVLFDKYLGDALYAAMIYAMLRLRYGAASAAGRAAAAMVAIECFQLTLIPARMLASEHLAVRLGGRLLGVHFSVADLAAYGVGIGVIYLLDTRQWRARLKHG
jgi:hypothetical protein